MNRRALTFHRSGLLCCGWLILAAWFLTGPVQAGGSNLLQLPFEDLLDMEIRSAGKRDEQIRDIPASVTILSREEIQRYGWVTFEELLRNVPGFYMLDTIDERILGNRGTAGGGVQLLVNGVPQHRSRQKALTIPEIAYLNIPVESIDRIEVVRGPMSVIYGNNAFLGVINVVTNDIGLSGPRISASYGERDTGRLFARLGKQFEGGFVALNAGAYRTEGLDAAYSDIMSPDQLATLRPGMHTSLDGDVPQQDLSLDLSAGWREWTANLRYTEKDYGFYAFTPSFDDGNHARVKTWHGALEWEHALKENLGLRAGAVVSEERVDFYEVDFLAPDLDGDQQLKYRQWDLELDLVWDLQPNLNMLAGYRFRQVEGIKNEATIPSLVETTNRVGRYVTHDFFADAGWSPSDRLRLSGGMRLSRLPDSYHYTSEDVLNDVFIVENVKIEDRTLITGRVSALWSLDADQIVKLMWGNATQDNDQIQFTEPERIETTELNYVATRSNWSLSASLFRNRISNIVRTVQRIDPATGDYLVIDDNSGEWVTNGLELIGEVRPVPELTLSGSVTWQDTEDQKTDISRGYSPELLVKLKADYRRGPMTYAAYAHYVSSMESDWDFVEGQQPDRIERLGEPVDAYWNLGLNLSYRPRSNGLYANLHVSNLLDEEIRYPAMELADFERGLIGPGRQITATIGYQF